MDEGKCKSNGQISHKECQVTGLFPKRQFPCRNQEKQKRWLEEGGNGGIMEVEYQRRSDEVGTFFMLFGGGMYTVR
jgi:hypothetical protein